MVTIAVLLAAAWQPSIWGARAAGIALGRALTFGPDPKQSIYFYPGEGAGPHKLLVIVHGGGWMTGAPDGEREAIPIFLALGFSVANIGYRLSPQVDGLGEVHDVAQGIAYVLSRSAELDIDRHDVTLLGHSSGGHLVALLGTDAHYLEDVHIDPRDIRRVVAFDGVYDLPSWSREKIKAGRLDNVTAVFGAAIADMEKMSPIFWAASTRMHPKFCLVSQSGEFHFADQARAFAAVLRAHNEIVELFVVPGLDHMQLFYRFDDETLPMEGYILRCMGDSGGQP